MSSIHTRIAPTPSGFLHLGNAFNFLLTEAIAHQNGGILRLRIDDLDSPRVRTEYLNDIFESLSWLGIQPDKGPQNISEQSTLFSQSLRLKIYQEGLQKLIDTGLVFACICSRKTISSTSEDGQYSGECLHKKIPLDQPDVTWRIQTPKDWVCRFDDAILGPVQIRLWDCQRHFTIRRRDGLPAYQLVSLLDDVAFGTNTIVRGEDLLSSTVAQLYLATLIGIDTFQEARFYHHPLLKDARGQKLSKSADSDSLKAIREKNIAPEVIRRNASDWYQPLLLRSAIG